MIEVSEDYVKMLETGIDFIRRMGVKVVQLKRGYVELKAPLELNLSHVGTMYAGALFSLAEVPGGALYLSTFDVTRFYPIVKEMTIRYKKPVTSAATVKVGMSEEEIQRVTREADETGKSEFVLTAELFNEAGALVCESVGTYQLRKMGT